MSVKDNQKAIKDLWAVIIAIIIYLVLQGVGIILFVNNFQLSSGYHEIPLTNSLNEEFASSLFQKLAKADMQVNNLIKVLCDGDNHAYRGVVYVDKIDDWYKQKVLSPRFEKQKAEYFKKYAKECKLANKRMSGNKNKYGNQPS